VLLLIGLTLLLVVWLIWSSLFAQPNRRDYEQALEQTKSLKQSQKRLEAASSEYVQAIVASLRLKLDGSNVARDTKEAADTYRQELRSYESAADRLETPRVARDTEVKGALKEANDHSDSILRSVRSITDDYDELYRAYVACDPVVRFNTTGAADTARYDSASKPCLAELTTLSKASTAELAGYAKKASELIRKKGQQYAANASLSDLRGVDVQLMMLDPLSSIQRLKQDLFATTKLDALQTLLERKRDAS
jgi:hypothetical protein